MRLLVIVFAVAMPIVAWLTNRGVFGPDNGTVSDRYPTLLVAAGYAFAIWGLIFLLNLVYAVWQSCPARSNHKGLQQTAPWAAAGFALTTAWMPLFAMGERLPMLFWLCLLVIVGALACMGRAALILGRGHDRVRGLLLWAWLPLSLHAGWLSVAVFLNLAQVIVAFELLPTDAMLGWSVALLALATSLLLWLNARMCGNPGYAAAAIWGLVAMHVKQSGWDLQGADTMAWLALAAATVLTAQTVWLRRSNLR